MNVLDFVELSYFVEIASEIRFKRDDTRLRNWIVRNLGRKKNYFMTPRLSKKYFDDDSKEHIIASALMKILSEYRELKAPRWAEECKGRLKEPLFIFRECETNEDLREWSIRTTPKSLSDHNIYACDRWLDVLMKDGRVKIKIK